MQQNKSYLPAILRLAWPTMLAEFMQTAVSYVDSAMVGRLGAAATATVGATSTVNWLIYGLISSLGIGFISWIARSVGAGEMEKVRRASSQVTLLVIVTSVVMTALSLLLSPVIPIWMQAAPEIQQAASRYFFIIYTALPFRTATILFSTCFRATGDTRTPMLIGVAVNLSNAILNYFLIYEPHVLTLLSLSLSVPGAGLGTDGAALATAISLAIGGIATCIVFFRSRVLSPIGLPLKPDRRILSGCFRVSLPGMLQRLATGFGYTIFSSMINSLGTVSLAAHSIANTAESAFYIPGWGMQAAAATLTGQAWGKKDNKLLKRQAKTLLRLEFIVMAFSGATLFLFAEALMGIFTNDPAVIQAGKTVLRMVAVSEPIYGVSIIVDGILQGVGDTFRTFLYNVIGMWGIRILGTFILLKFGVCTLTGAWACMIAHNCLLGILLWIRYRRGKWNPLDRDDAQVL